MYMSHGDVIKTGIHGLFGTEGYVVCVSAVRKEYVPPSVTGSSRVVEQRGGYLRLEIAQAMHLRVYVLKIYG